MNSQNASPQSRARACVTKFPVTRLPPMKGSMQCPMAGGNLCSRVALFSRVSPQIPGLHFTENIGAGSQENTGACSHCKADCYICRSQPPPARHSPFPQTRSSLASPHSSPFPRAPQPPLTSPPYAPASPRSPPYTPASPPYTPAALRSPPYSAGDEVVYARPGPGLGARSLTQVFFFFRYLS